MKIIENQGNENLIKPIEWNLQNFTDLYEIHELSWTFCDREWKQQDPLNIHVNKSAEVSEHNRKSMNTFENNNSNEHIWNSLKSVENHRILIWKELMFSLLCY